jgi:hypothetical protein
VFLYQALLVALVIRQPSNSQSLDFETVEVISRDNIIPSADLKNKYLDFSKQPTSAARFK